MHNEPVISQSQIENRIFTIRGMQVMIDYHLAEIYNVETKRLNEQVKRNNKRFPQNFMFQLSINEWEILQSQIATANVKSGLQSQNATTKRRTIPYVFTEQGVAMLSAILKSDSAILASIQIIDTFVKMRKIILENTLLDKRFESIELKLMNNEQKFEKIFKALETKEVLPTQGIFYDGQVFDAYELTSKIIKTAKQTIILIDNYIDESVITHLSKKNKNVNVIILTKNISKQLELDIKKANEQYGNFEIRKFDKSHDRFLIIDNVEVYHLGASLKDLGKKWFAFSKLEPQHLSSLFIQINDILN